MLEPFQRVHVSNGVVLDTVPNGETRSLGNVLKALGMDGARLQEPRYHIFNHTISIGWRLSPSSDLVGLASPSGADVFDLAGQVYGVQIVKRGAHDAWAPWKSRTWRRTSPSSRPGRFSVE